MTVRASPHLEKLTPAARTIGKKLLSSPAESEEVRLEFLAKPEFGNRHGTVGGGFLAAMLDSAAATPLLAKLPPERSVVTTDLHVEFLRPASLGRILASGRIVSQSEGHAESEAELSMPDGTVVARARAKFRFVARR